MKPKRPIMVVISEEEDGVNLRRYASEWVTPPSANGWLHRGDYVWGLTHECVLDYNGTDSVSDSVAHFRDRPPAFTRVDRYPHWSPSIA